MVDDIAFSTFGKAGLLHEVVTSRGATFDLAVRGAWGDGRSLLDGREVDLIDADFDLDEVLLVDRDDEDERLDEREEEAWPPFWAPNVAGSKSSRR